MYFEDADKLINNDVKSLWYSVLCMEMKDGLVYCQWKQVMNESMFAISACFMCSLSVYIGKITWNKVCHVGLDTGKPGLYLQDT